MPRVRVAGTEAIASVAARAVRRTMRAQRPVRDNVNMGALRVVAPSLRRLTIGGCRAASGSSGLTEIGFRPRNRAGQAARGPRLLRPGRVSRVRPLFESHSQANGGKASGAAGPQTLLSGIDPHAPELLGGEGLRYPAAL